MDISPLFVSFALSIAGIDASNEPIDTGIVTFVKPLRNSSSGLRNCTEHPEECPRSPLPNLRRSKPLAGAAGFRFQEDWIGFQLGVHDSGSTSGQWVIGIAGSRDGSESRRDSLHFTTTFRALAPRIGREMWYSGPGPFVLVGSAMLQASWQWTDLEIDTTVHILRSSYSSFSDKYSIEERAKILKTRTMSVSVLLGWVFGFLPPQVPSPCPWAWKPARVGRA
ncbi:MAG: hypothetical protein IPO40_07615 [Fibrobacteres bacterium]|nr:hypothetical protein [Fibrobacterota bacterium]